MVQNGILENFSIDDYGCLRFYNRICVSDVSKLKELIFREAHDSLFALHPGGTKMYRDLLESYWWPGMKRNVVEYVAKYLTCRRVKAEHQVSTGLLQPITIPEWKWNCITMDFVTGLPLSASWERYLPLAEFAYNNSFQSGIQMAPYEALYGRRCRSPICWMKLSERKMIMPELIQETEDIVKKIRDRLKIAFDRQKSYADLKRRDIEYSIGDKKIHDVFHVSMLRRYRSDPSHVISTEDIEIQPDFSYEEKPVEILAHEVEELRNK
ncbi:uncharacterized protein LOC105761633 [Gossypium raimondii]|uniref:uncharacterized protein LOC105761633 n=1 Tax=Gossypium raimondii TaxID=29730 RepID=UPI00063AA248|nr:uncharacterized protein LOC105761633 [Gossypium raimondii]